MKNSCNRNQTLKYTSPAHGGWGVVRVGMLVPESYQLFVCPFACGRHGAIGAIKQKLKDRLSYLYIEEADIVSGSYENLIPEAVAELFAVLTVRPKVLMIFVSCLDDLLGTDHAAIEDILSAKYPETMFTFCHMNPITQDGNNPPPVNIRRKMYGLIQKQTGLEHSVNVLGNPVPLAESCELQQVLGLAGIEKVNQIGNCQTFQEFQDMGKARLNIVTAAPALRAAEDMKRRLGIDYVYVPVSYDSNEIEQQYQAIFTKLGISGGIDLSAYRCRAESAVAAAVQAAQGCLMAIDYTAVGQLYGAVKALQNYGFSVKQIFAPEPKGAEQQFVQQLQACDTQLKISNPQDHMVPATWGNDQDYAAIGYEAAYLTGSKRIVNLVNDEGNFGFDGIVRLMELILEGISVERDLQEMINNYGLVI